MEPSAPHGRDAYAILLAAGVGRRLGNVEPKALLPIDGHPILAVAAGSAAASASVGGLVITFPVGWEGRARACVESLDFPVRFVEGGPSRQASVRAALEDVPGSVPVVAVHDAARPFAGPELFDRAIGAVRDGIADGAVPVVEIADTILRVEGDAVHGTVPRDELFLGQTPQAFRAAALRAAHERAAEAEETFTDDASLLRWAGHEVRAVPGDPDNRKITTLADLAEADRRMAGVDE
ncbi:MAG TPA: 2-C-methyl-D-erythritol 4-phosphate cytidylyltransferase [Actinomycetota bacterium]|nr:2-C-methyl-D-erythritol 4-phosphate cytidylyltransferase [Actinomycetota bacterium]